MLKRKKVKPITLRDVTIIDDSKLKKAITAASLGNAMEWFDFWGIWFCCVCSW
ncbi:proline/glycine betaine transporter [Klebsiella oxytoca]|nr:proline/glycine betaine transporter [Klebsiella oxytoca]